MIPSAGVGIVVLTNAAPSGSAKALGASFTDLVQFGMVTRDWFAAYTPIMAGLTAPVGDLVGKSPAERWRQSFRPMSVSMPTLILAVPRSPT
jgi:hypothetical protein